MKDRGRLHYIFLRNEVEEKGRKQYLAHFASTAFFCIFCTFCIFFIFCIFCILCIIRLLFSSPFQNHISYVCLSVGCSCICVWRTCVCLRICIFVRIWIADIMGFQKIYGLRGPWGLTAVLQPIYEHRKNCCGWVDGTDGRTGRRRYKRSSQT